jgi:hypothetical protein
MLPELVIRDGNESGRVITRLPAMGLRVEIRTRTCTRRISDVYQVPVGFVIPHVKTISK